MLKQRNAVADSDFLEGGFCYTFMCEVRMKFSAKSIQYMALKRHKESYNNTSYVRSKDTIVVGHIA